MIRSILFCCLLVLTVTPLNAQESTPLGSLKLDLSRLKTWGTRQYSYEATPPGSGEKAGEGRVVLKTEVGPDSITLDDNFALIYRGKELSLHLTHQCQKDNFLSPKRIESKGEGDDELGTFIATIEGDEPTVRSDGRERKMEFPQNIVTSAAFSRIVTLLPRQEGKRISFPNWLESEELNLKKDFVVGCMGQETVPSGQEGVTCTKFRLTGGGIRPVYYWVDDEGVLRQVLIDERKWMRLRNTEDKDR